MEVVESVSKMTGSAGIVFAARYCGIETGGKIINRGYFCS